MARKDYTKVIYKGTFVSKQSLILEIGNLSLCETTVDQKNPSTDLDWRNQWQQILAESLLFASSLLDCCSAKLCQNYEWGKQETKTSSLRVNTLFLNQNVIGSPMTTVSFDHGTFDHGLLTTSRFCDIWPQWHLTAGHLTASDIWPRDIWLQVTFDRGTFDRSDIWPRDIWPQWHLTAGRLTAGRLTTGHLTAVTFNHGILDRQPRLEKLDRKWHLTTGPLTASDVWPRDVWPQWHLTAGFLTSNQD